MNANDRRIVPGQRNVAHLPAPPLDPLSEQIHRRYRERRENLKARYARIAPSSATTDEAPTIPSSDKPSFAPANPVPTPTLSSEEDDAWLAMLVAEHRARESAADMSQD